MSRRRKPTTGTLAGAAPLFAALGDETRLALVARLSQGGPWSIARLTEGASITRQAVTKHLNVLAGAGLVRDARRGRERLWELEPARLAAARGALDEISRRWDEALGRLRRHVEEGAPLDRVSAASARSAARTRSAARRSRSSSSRASPP